MGVKRGFSDGQERGCVAEYVVQHTLALGTGCVRALRRFWRSCRFVFSASIRHFYRAIDGGSVSFTRHVRFVFPLFVPLDALCFSVSLTGVF